MERKRLRYRVGVSQAARIRGEKETKIERKREGMKAAVRQREIYTLCCPCVL